MKKFLFLGLVLSLMAVSSPSRAQEEAKKGASEKAYEHASDNSIFNRVSDWFATVGKSDEEKEKILQERKRERQRKRLEKEAEKVQKEAEKETERASERVGQTGRKARGDSEEIGSLFKGKAKGKNK